MRGNSFRRRGSSARSRAASFQESLGSVGARLLRQLDPPPRSRSSRSNSPTATAARPPSTTARSSRSLPPAILWPISVSSGDGSEIGSTVGWVSSWFTASRSARPKRRRSRASRSRGRSRTFGPTLSKRQRKRSISSLEEAESSTGISDSISMTFDPRPDPSTPGLGEWVYAERSNGVLQLQVSGLTFDSAFAKASALARRSLLDSLWGRTPSEEPSTSPDTPTTDGPRSEASSSTARARG